MRIVVVQTAYLGDIVLTTPLLRELRRAQPEARLSLVTTEAGARLLEASPDLDEVLTYDKRWTRRGLASFLRLARRLVGGGFDIAIAAHRSARTGVLLALSRAPRRVGFSGAAGAWAYGERVEWDRGAHAVRRYLALASAAGGDPQGADPRPWLGVTAEARRRVDALLSSEGLGPHTPLLAVAPGSVWATKRWLPEGFARIVRAAPSRGLSPVLIGSPEERSLCQSVAALAGGRVSVLAGRTGVADLVAIVARARLLVGNDSGPAHVASAVGTPVLSVFGPTAASAGYAAFGPRTRTVEHRALDCRPCSRHGGPTCPLGHFRCMLELSPDDVLREMDALLASTATAEGWPGGGPGQELPG